MLYQSLITNAIKRTTLVLVFMLCGATVLVAADNSNPTSTSDVPAVVAKVTNQLLKLQPVEEPVAQQTPSPVPMASTRSPACRSRSRVVCMDSPALLARLSI